MLFIKKKSFKRLQYCFLHLWLSFYILQIVSYDFLYKFQILNIPQLLAVCSTQQSSLSLNISDNLNNLHELSDTFLVLKNLTKQKPNLFKKSFLMKQQVFCKLDLKNNNYYYFLNIFLCYIFPIIKKRQTAFFLEQYFNFKKKQYFFSEFHLYLNSTYDFLENKNILYTFDFNIIVDSNKIKNLSVYYLSALNIHTNYE